MWTHNMIACMYIEPNYNIVVVLVAHAITMQLLKKSNMVNYIFMYDVYKMSYTKPIFNSLVTIIQLTNFLTWQFIY